MLENFTSGFTFCQLFLQFLIDHCTAGFIWLFVHLSLSSVMKCSVMPVNFLLCHKSKLFDALKLFLDEHPKGH